MGVIGLSEYEYYTNLPYTNYCKLKGYEDRVEHEAVMLRIASYRIHQSLVQKPLSITDYWPLPSDKETKKDTLFVSRDILKQIKQAHGLE